MRRWRVGTPNTHTSIRDQRSWMRVCARRSHCQIFRRTNRATRSFPVPPRRCSRTCSRRMPITLRHSGTKLPCRGCTLAFTFARTSKSAKIMACGLADIPFNSRRTTAQTADNNLEHEKRRDGVSTCGKQQFAPLLTRETFPYFRGDGGRQRILGRYRIVFRRIVSLGPNDSPGMHVYHSDVDLKVRIQLLNRAFDQDVKSQ